MKIGLELGKLKFLNLGVVFVPALVPDAGDLDTDETEDLLALNTTAKRKTIDAEAVLKRKNVL